MINKNKEEITMNKSKETYSLIKKVSLVEITCICLFVYSVLLPMIKAFGLPQEIGGISHGS